MFRSIVFTFLFVGVLFASDAPLNTPTEDFQPVFPLMNSVIKRGKTIQYYHDWELPWLMDVLKCNSKQYEGIIIMFKPRKR